MKFNRKILSYILFISGGSNYLPNINNRTNSNSNDTINSGGSEISAAQIIVMASLIPLGSFGIFWRAHCVYSCNPILSIQAEKKEQKEQEIVVKEQFDR